LLLKIIHAALPGRPLEWRAVDITWARRPPLDSRLPDLSVARPASRMNANVDGDHTTAY